MTGRRGTGAPVIGAELAAAQAARDRIAAATRREALRRAREAEITRRAVLDILAAILTHAGGRP